MDTTSSEPSICFGAHCDLNDEARLRSTGPRLVCSGRLQRCTWRLRYRLLWRLWLSGVPLPAHCCVESRPHLELDCSVSRSSFSRYLGSGPIIASTAAATSCRSSNGCHSCHANIPAGVCPSCGMRLPYRHSRNSLIDFEILAGGTACFVKTVRAQNGG